MSKDYGRFDNRPFENDLEFNAAMYTMVGRAKEFVFLSNPKLEISTPIVDPEIAKSKDDNLQEFGHNSKLHMDHWVAANNIARIMEPEKAAENPEGPTRPPEDGGGPNAPQQPTQEEVNKTVTEILPESVTKDSSTLIDDEFTEIEDAYEDIEVEDEIENEEEEHHSPVQEIPAPIPPRPPRRTAEMEYPGSFAHSFAYPTNRLIYPKHPGDTSADIDVKGDSHIVVDEDGVAHLIQVKGKTAYHLAELGSNELKEEGFANMKKVLDEVTPVTNLDKSSLGFELQEDITDLSAGVVHLERVHGLRYQLNSELSNKSDTLTDVITKWYEGFYNNAAGGRGVLPIDEFFSEDGEIN